jgi:hypothetical protein
VVRRSTIPPRVKRTRLGQRSQYERGGQANDRIDFDAVARYQENRLCPLAEGITLGVRFAATDLSLALCRPIDFGCPELEGEARKPGASFTIAQSSPGHPIRK